MIEITKATATGNIVLAIAKYSENDYRKVVLRRMDDYEHTEVLNETQRALYSDFFDRYRLPNDMLEVLDSFLISGK